MFAELIRQLKDAPDDAVLRLVREVRDGDWIVLAVNPPHMARSKKMQRLLGQMTGCCFQRCVGLDSFNALDVVTYKMDQELGTEYNARFRTFLSIVQEEDLVRLGRPTHPTSS